MVETKAEDIKVVVATVAVAVAAVAVAAVATATRQQVVPVTALAAPTMTTEGAIMIEATRREALTRAVLMTVRNRPVVHPWDRAVVQRLVTLVHPEQTAGGAMSIQDPLEEAVAVGGDTVAVEEAMAVEDTDVVT